MKKLFTRSSLLSIAALLLLIGAGCKNNNPAMENTADSMQQDNNPAMMEKDGSDSNMEIEENNDMKANERMEKDEPNMKGDAMMNETDTQMMEKEDAMMEDQMEESAMEKNTKGSYEAYAPEKIARAEQGDVILFFHAPWCPYCRNLDSDINNSLTDIPDGVNILKTNYDNETALKKKYGVTYQHTFVQVDENGNEINKWSGSNTLEELLANIK